MRFGTASAFCQAWAARTLFPLRSQRSNSHTHSVECLSFWSHSAACRTPLSALDLFLGRIQATCQSGNFPFRLSGQNVAPRGYLALPYRSPTQSLLEIIYGPCIGGPNAGFPEIPAGKSICQSVRAHPQAWSLSLSVCVLSLGALA